MFGMRRSGRRRGLTGVGGVCRKKIGGRGMKEINTVECKTVKYKNGITTKLPNKRITTFEVEGGVAVEFRVLDDSPTEPRSLFKTIKGKVAQTTIKLSDEAAFVLMMQLAETFGVGVCEKDRGKNGRD